MAAAGGLSSLLFVLFVAYTFAQTPSPSTPSPTPSPSPSSSPSPAPSFSPTPTPKGCDEGTTSQNVALGFIAAMVSVLFFGTNYVPVKKYDPGDGFFFQWVMCLGIFLIGFVVACFRLKGEEAINFYPFAMLGGFFWCTGNVLTVTTVKLIGLGLGILLWGMSNLAMGWFTGTFGLFGTAKGEVDIPVLNYIGFVMACGSMGVFAFVKPSTAEPNTASERQSLVHLQDEDSSRYDGEQQQLADPKFGPTEYTGKGIDIEGFIERKFGEKKVYLGFALALFMGILFGNNFTPAERMINHYCENGVIVHSNKGIDYVFSEFIGILLTSTIYFIIYCAATKNGPSVNHRIVLPALICGMMWGIAQASFFIANSQLGLNVAFPIIALGPGIVASIIGIVVYKEIQGTKNLLVFLLAFVIAVVAVILITLSKIA